jgi:aspartate carbamoyltransferase regulatory subunit
MNMSFPLVTIQSNFSWKTKNIVDEAHYPHKEQNMFKCRSTNCRHKAQQFIQLWYLDRDSKNQNLIIGYCKKHAKSEAYAIKKWNFGWVFDRFMDKNEVIVNEIMGS